LTIFQLKQILQRYPVEGARYLAKELNREEVTVQGIAFRMGVKAENWRSRMVRTRARNKTNVDVSYFQGEMAYILGYIYADGCIDDRSLRLRCQTKDEEIILAIRDRLKSSHHLLRRPSQGKRKAVTSIVISNHILVENLRDRFGVQPNKSRKDLSFPTLNQYYGAFCRGYLDGDGFVGSTRVRAGFCGSPQFIYQMRDFLVNNLGLSKVEPWLNKGIRVVEWQTVEALGKLYKFLYQEITDLGLLRKKVLFLKYLTQGV